MLYQKFITWIVYVIESSIGTDVYIRGEYDPILYYADDIDMDISTISRVVNGKYVQLPWEVKELRSFFSEGITMDDGTEVANSEVKMILNDIISNEDKKNPYKDEDLATILSEKGFKIARRTISKYREELNFPVSRLRKEI